MTIRHLNCASMNPLAAPRMVAHCLLVERPEGLLLVDTGFGAADCADPKRLGRAFRTLVRPVLDPAETAVAQVRALGHDPADVTDIALPPLDLDHVGGLADFPAARVHVFADELDAALHPTLREKGRYLDVQRAHGPRCVTHDVPGDEWFGFGSVTALADDVLLIPLQGHTRGHCGVAVRRPDGGWLLHAGDSYFFHGEKDTPSTCPRGLSIFQSVVQVDKAARHENADRVRSLHADHGPDSGSADVVTVFSAHDAVELDALADVTD